MNKVQNIEVINLQEKNGKLVVIISYQDLSEIHNINNGYNWQEIPVNIRAMQKSSRDNYLVDQSEKFFVDVANSEQNEAQAGSKTEDLI
jgi:hypothetical protein